MSETMSRTNFLATDLVAAINATSIDGTDFTSQVIKVGSYGRIGLTFYVLGGNASCAQSVTFKFASYDTLRGTWDTIDPINDGAGIAIAMNGTTAVQKTIVLSVGFQYLKLLSVQNPETVAGYTATVNVSVFLADRVD